MMSITRERKRANFKAIEMELRYYPQLKQQLEDARADIIEATPFSDVSVETELGNSVLSKVIQLQSSAALQETSRRVRAIEYALEETANRCDTSRVRLIELKYFDNKLTNEGIMQELKIGSNSFYRWRREFVRLVAERLGWVV